MAVILSYIQYCELTEANAPQRLIGHCQKYSINTVSCHSTPNVRLLCHNNSHIIAFTALCSVCVCGQSTRRSCAGIVLSTLRARTIQPPTCPPTKITAWAPCIILLLDELIKIVSYRYNRFSWAGVRNVRTRFKCEIVENGKLTLASIFDNCSLLILQ